ncbi:MAG: GDP-mannose 4,6-dehydratase [Patescibacteria group bacterium]
MECGRGALENMEGLNPTAESKGFWKNRAVLITGGDGFVGSRLGHALMEQGSRVFLLGSKERLPELDPASRALVSRSTYVCGDIRDRALMEQMLAGHRIQTVFHLAAKAIVGEALGDPTEALDINVRGTWTVLEAARSAAKDAEIVVASSDKAYGSHRNLPYQEDYPLQGRNPYDCSKSCADLVAQMYAETYGLNIAITRCANIYGGGDVHFSRLIPDTIRSIHYGKSPVIRSDGLFRRDYVYIADIVSAYRATAEWLGGKNQKKGEAFNFGTNASHEARDVVEKISRLMRSSLPPVILAEARYEIRDQYLNAEKARTALGWSPRFTLDEGLKETVSWYQDFFTRQDNAQKSAGA